MPDILLHPLAHLLAAIGYAGLGYYFWHTRWRATARSANPLTMQAWERAAIAGVLLSHGAILFGAMFPPPGNLHFSFSLAVSLMLWLAVLLYWLESFRARMDGMQPIVLPLAALSGAIPAFFPQSHEIAHASAPGFQMHFLTAMLAYSLFTLSALHALFMSFIEHQLHRKTLAPHMTSLPPVLAMEALLFRIIGIAFVLLTLTLISGLAFSEQVFGKAFVFDHKTVFAFASWLIFAALLAGRRRYGWRGRIALRWTLTGFLLLFLAYIGSRFVVEVLLGRV